jgi:DNA polymerase-3 subunit delta
MAAKKEDISFFGLLNDIKAKNFKPIYVLHGEESYYIDRLEEAIVENALTPDEQDFNLNVIYGADINDIRTVISMCKQYPAMARYQVVVIREAQNVGKTNNKGTANELNQLKHYAEQPQPTTIFVVCNKNEAIKGREFVDAVKKNKTGVVFRSDKLREGRPMELAALDYIKRLGCSIDEKALSMLASNVGNDISRLYTEIDKLKILVKDDKRITPELIERNIGISKDYNNFELEQALATRNAKKAFEIINYYEKNPKANPTVITVSMLFGYFSKLLIFRTMMGKSEAELMDALGTKSTWRVKKIAEASKFYSTAACVNIITWIRECDVKSKGIGSRQDATALLRELIYKILHA